jgi:hypothetical protein
MAEFKIGRLRFSWVGEWVTSTVYNRDEIVQYNGKSYVCIEPHTASANFYDDLNYIDPVEGLQIRWTLMMTGQTWKGSWQQNTLYSLDNIVIFGGIVYKCNQDHTSGIVLETDSEKWDIYSESNNWKDSWLPGVVYGLGDIVNYGGTTYQCIESHVASISVPLGLEDDLEKWEVYAYGNEYRGEYAAAIRYKLNDLVNFGSNQYICIIGHTSTSTFNPNNWEIWLPGIEFENEWDSAASYQPGDVVIYGGYLYISLTLNNVNNIPPVNAGAWDLLTISFNIRGEYDEASDLYQVGDVVRRNGQLYTAIADSISEDPIEFSVITTYNPTGSSGTTVKLANTSGISVGMTIIGAGFTRGQIVNSVVDVTTIIVNEEPDGTLTNNQPLEFVGVNSSYWAMLVPGTKFLGRWTPENNYKVGDITYWKNATYICTNNHIASTLTRPDTDVDRLYWAVYLEHNIANALNNPGEIVSYQNGNTVAVPIGNNTNVLKSTDSFPTWSEIFFTPSAYYVAENGIDDPARGTTWDIPWRTIKYACSRVAEGIQNPNAKFIIEQNKEFIVQETLQWLIYQFDIGAPGFNTNPNLDYEKTVRDSRYTIDAILYDLIRGGNSQTVALTLSYFNLESGNKFINEEVEDQIQFFINTLNRLFLTLNFVLGNTPPPVNYQELNEIPDPVEQIINLLYTQESGVTTIVSALQGILINALINGNVSNVPATNQGLTTSIFIKSGTYEEAIPIVVPANTALVGDELRGVVVRPASVVNTLATRTDGDTDVVTVGSTINMDHNTPVQFVSLNPVTEISTVFGNIVNGQTYYVIGDSITPTTFTMSETPDGPPVNIVTNTGFMRVYGGEALHDMFYVQNGTGIRNMTLNGLLGTLTEPNEFLTRRPTGGAYVSLDPGTGPDDTSAWIIRKSPYVQNVTNFGTGCIGLKIDSTLHDGGNRSVVCNDFTQILSDGIGIWCTGGEALCEAVSVFSYYNYAGYFSENGGRIRATNGNSSYGIYGCVAEGFALDETPGTGTVFNRSTQATAEAISSFGANADILKIQFTHAGENYVQQTTNLLTNSNNFLSGWTTDGNVTILQARSSPFGVAADAWELLATTGLSDSSYIFQNITVAPPGSVFTSVSGVNISGSGVGATFNITVSANSYSVVVNAGGSGYVVENQIRILGSVFGGIDGLNDLIITVGSLSISAILTVTSSGVVPIASDLNYTFSIYAQKGTSSSFDIYSIFSGVSTVSSAITYNFNTEELTGQSINNVQPTNLVATKLSDGWYRISFSVYDVTARNSTLQYRIYPRGVAGIPAYTNIYGAQLQIGSELTYYLQTTNSRPTAYADFRIFGAGSDAEVVGDELRSNSIYQSRIITGTTAVGGSGYLTVSNNAQGGATDNIIIAQSDVNTPEKYEGMRIFVNSGTGAGQYATISQYDEITKTAYVLKESFDSLEITQSDEITDRLSLSSSADFNSLYINQAIQFTPTFYTTTIRKTNQAQVSVTETIGGINNVMKVDSTARLTVGMEITFTDSVFGGVIENFSYYIIDISDSTTIQISTAFGGAAWPLTPVVGNMTLNYPSNTSYLVADSTDNMSINRSIQFTGSGIGGVTLGQTYYINDIFDSTTFTISQTLVTVAANGTSSVDNSITCDTTTALRSLYPIEFNNGSAFGNLAVKTKYYINRILTPTEFTISTSLLTRTATVTTAGSNLITVNSTTGFIADAPIVFTGTTFGNIINDQVYYISVVNNSTTFTISSTPGGASFNINTATGSVIVRTVADIITQTTASGSLIGTTTSTKQPVSSDSGAMEASFNTTLFGSVVSGTTYYVLEKFAGTPNQFTITDTSGGSIAVSLTSDAGSMQIGSVGWDHINPGTPDTPFFDSTSVYVIEPKIAFSEPVFSEQLTTLPLQPSGIDYISIKYGDRQFMAIPKRGNVISVSSDAYITTGGSQTLPTSASWADIAYGNNYWVLMSWAGSGSGSRILYSASTGQSWKSATLPSISGWSKIAYGNGNFVAMSSGRAYNNISTTTGGAGINATFNVKVSGTEYYIEVNNEGSGYIVTDTLTIAGSLLGGTSPGNDITITVTLIGPTGQISNYTISGTAISGSIAQPAYSTNNGATWTSSTGMPDAAWSDIAYGARIFVAIAKGTSTAAYSTDNGVTWASTLLPAISNWSAISFGNGRFVAVSSSLRSPIYSFDGITWYESPYTISATLLTYGQGVFLALSSASGTAYTSAGGLTWKTRSVAGTGYLAAAFGYTQLTTDGYFVTVAPDSTSSYIAAGVRAQARPTIVNGQISQLSFWETGSGYTTAPELSVFDPNNSEEVTTSLRIGNGVLSGPTFINRGSGYNTTSTAITIRGNGYADKFQVGLRVVCNNLTRVPAPGDNFEFAGNPIVYKVAVATVLFGTTAPNITAIVQLSPEVTIDLSPSEGTSFTILSKYSQVRLTNHDFLNIGFGNQFQSNYPNRPINTELEVQDEVVETNNGRVFFTSTDQDGNFRVGDLFAVEQATGIVTLNASEFGVSGLERLSLGGVAVGASNVIIQQFSTDPAFTQNSNAIIPTQKAIKTYLASRLSQGGSNTFTGLLIAGTTKIGGPDEIGSTIPEGNAGWVVNVPVKVNVSGPTGAWAGDGLAMSYFMKTWWQPGAL